jgi:glycosyltransferase involved in cell wall biosynthesis
MNKQISAVILTKNEEKNIKDCLTSVKWVDELIIVDDFSTDKTLEIVKRFNTTVYQRELNFDFSAQRNFVLSKINTDWVLFIDADERISEELKNEIIGKISFPNLLDAYSIKRLDMMWGKVIKHGEQGNVRFVRLFKSKVGKFFNKVHEDIKINGKVGRLNNPIIHYPHQSIREFLEKLNLYSDIRSDELREKRVKTNWFLILCYTLGKFFKNYFVKLGILDGIRGLILAVLMSLHSFLSRGKLWLLWQKK